VDRIETLVKEAHNEWQSQAKEFRNFLKEHMSKEHLIAVQVNDLDRQVGDGGFRQWYYLGYDTDLEDLIRYCQEIGTETCVKVKVLLEHLRETIMHTC